MGMELHGMADDVSHLVVSSVVHSLHGVEDAPLHGLQSVLDMRHGTLQDYIRGVIQEPVLVHSAEMVHGGSVEAVGGGVVAVGIRRLGLSGVVRHIRLAGRFQRVLF